MAAARKHSIARSSIVHIAKRWRQPRCPSAGEWVNNRVAVPSVEYYSAMKKKEALTWAPTWLNLNITLSEGSGTKDHLFFDSIPTKSPALGNLGSENRRVAA